MFSFKASHCPQDLKAELRQIPSVALLFVSRAVMLLEPPSNASKAVSAKVGLCMNGTEDARRKSVHDIQTERDVSMPVTGGRR